MTGARAAVAVVAGVSVLALGACTGSEAEPRFAPSPSAPAGSSGTPTRAPGPVEPTMPAAARGTDAAAAEAFVRFYWEMADYAQATGRLDGLDALADQTCVACKAGIDYLSDIQRRNGEISGGTRRVTGISSAPLTAGGEHRVVVQATVSYSRQVVDFPGRSRDRVSPAGRAALKFLLKMTPSGWRLLYWGEDA